MGTTVMGKNMDRERELMEYSASNIRERKTV